MDNQIDSKSRKNSFHHGLFVSMQWVTYLRKCHWDCSSLPNERSGCSNAAYTVVVSFLCCTLDRYFSLKKNFWCGPFLHSLAELCCIFIFCVLTIIFTWDLSATTKRIRSAIPALVLNRFAISILPLLFIHTWFWNFIGFIYPHDHLSMVVL